MKTLVCFLEERSAKEMLEGILPRLLSDDIRLEFIVFKGKQNLEKHLEDKLRRWSEPDSVFLIMRDQDSADCKVIKKRLVDLCHKAGKPEALVRIACRELENFYFGDLNAVEKGLGLTNIAGYQNKAKYRDPDSIVNASNELKKLTNGNYQKNIGSRNIAPHLSLENNASRSFNVLISGIKRLFAEK